MENINEHIDNLILRYKKGTITSIEEDELLLWIEKDDEHRTYFKEQMAILETIDPPAIQFSARQSLKDLDKITSPRKPYSLQLKWIAVAASVALLLAVGSIFLIHQPKVEAKICRLTANNPTSFYILDDKSEITLSKGSSLIKPQQFNSKIRKVELKGKAFFKVARDVNRPFIITAGKIEVRVLGTSFEVENDSINNMVKVSVSEGIVSVNYKETNFSKKLTKNKQITISQQGILINDTTLRNENHLAWKTGILVFNNIPMKEVTKDLTRLYGKIFFFKDTEIKDYLLTTKIDKQSLAEVKLILGQTLDIGVTERNDTIFLRKKP